MWWHLLLRKYYLGNLKRDAGWENGDLAFLHLLSFSLHVEVICHSHTCILHRLELAIVPGLFAFVNNDRGSTERKMIRDSRVHRDHG